MQRLLRATRGIMKNVGVFIVMALGFSASGAPLRQHAASTTSEANVTCVWNQSCPLPCPFEGRIHEAYWVCEDKPMIPIVYYPKNQERHLRGEFRNMSSLSLDQPEGGAVLLLRGVQAQHEGQYRCSVTSSSGHTTRRVHLRLHNGFDLKYLWALSGTALIPLVVFLFIYFGRRKKKSQPTSHQNGNGYLHGSTHTASDTGTETPKRTETVTYSALEMQGLQRIDLQQ